MGERTVLITGGTGTLGSAVTERFLDQGHTVVTTYIDSEEWDDLSKSLDSERLSGYKTDVTSAEQVEGLVERVMEDQDGVDILLNLVGGYAGGKELHEVDEATWDTMLGVNLKSAFLVSRAVIPLMRENGFGRIVNVGSKLGSELPPEGGPYAIAKRGVEALTALIAKENAGHDITVNCVNPSKIGTAGQEPGDIADRIVSVVEDAEQNGEIIALYGD